MCKSAQKRISVDFDGVLHGYSAGWQDGKIYDLPVDGAVKALKQLVERGFSYVVFTTRLADREDIDTEEQERLIRIWLDSAGFPEPEMITGQKVPSLAYIDDRALRFTNLEDIRKLWV